MIEHGLNPSQREDYARYRAFAAEHLAPNAERWDRDEAIDAAGIDALRPWLGTTDDLLRFGLLNEAVGHACSSARSLFTVHAMVLRTLSKWGSAAHKDTWLDGLERGEKIGAFALTEPDVGSNARAIECSARLDGETYVVDGHKKWTTFAQIADVFLLFAQDDGKPIALLVPADSPGLTITPTGGLLGTRASMLGELHLEGCRVPVENRIGGPGMGISVVAYCALAYGRFSVAWGAVGAARAARDASRRYAAQREQFGKPLKDHQLVQRMLTNMITGVRASWLMCERTAAMHDAKDGRWMAETSIAKYFATSQLSSIASDAVQIHGGIGCSDQAPVARIYRDAKVLEIIEGNHEVQQMSIPRLTENET